MEHVVFFPAPDGTPGFRRTSHLEDAVRLVEHLRNVEGIEQVDVFSLTAVPLSFRAYYHVEMPHKQALSAPARHEQVTTDRDPGSLLPPDLPRAVPAADVVPIGDREQEPVVQEAVPALAEPAGARESAGPALALVEDAGQPHGLTVDDTRDPVPAAVDEAAHHGQDVEDAGEATEEPAAPEAQDRADDQDQPAQAYEVPAAQHEQPAPEPVAVAVPAQAEAPTEAPTGQDDEPTSHRRGGRRSAPASLGFFA